MRKEALAVGEYYHIFTKSIAGFQVFNNDAENTRIREVICHYQKINPLCKLSEFIELSQEQKLSLRKESSKSGRLVDIIAYCIMPTHLHFILRQIEERGISIFMKNILNSYSRYFNLRHNRKGPLWEGRFKNVNVFSDEQLLHLTRYIHLNPVTAFLVENPRQWRASSYLEYLEEIALEEKICNYKEVFNICPDVYSRFVNDGISYQRDLAKIKNILLD